MKPINNYCNNAEAGEARPLKVVYRLIDDIKLDHANPRRHSKKQMRQISDSLNTFGFNVPILIEPEPYKRSRAITISSNSPYSRWAYRMACSREPRPRKTAISEVPSSSIFSVPPVAGVLAVDRSIFSTRRNNNPSAKAGRRFWLSTSTCPRRPEGWTPPAPGVKTMITHDHTCATRTKRHSSG
ncbi:MAG: hypothetical protein ACJ8AH_04940 [Stellaceae bacterium]